MLRRLAFSTHRSAEECGGKQPSYPCTIPLCNFLKNRSLSGSRRLPEKACLCLAFPAISRRLPRHWRRHVFAKPFQPHYEVGGFGGTARRTKQVEIKHTNQQVRTWCPHALMSAGTPRGRTGYAPKAQRFSRFLVLVLANESAVVTVTLLSSKGEAPAPL